jgi:septum formation topological specificity factor MinE
MNPHIHAGILVLLAGDMDKEAQKDFLTQLNKETEIVDVIQKSAKSRSQERLESYLESQDNGLGFRFKILLQERGPRTSARGVVFDIDDE